MTSNSFQHKCLIQQGYKGLDASELRQLEWGLRFTPAVCSSITVVGLVLALPPLLFAVSALGIWAFFAPAAHPMDLLYNYVIRPMFGAVKLPPNPLPRRMACLAAGVMNFAAAILFLMHAPIAARIVGAVLLALQAIVIFSHFCTLSWMLEELAKVFRQGEKMLAPEEARELACSGALLIDVRTELEFSHGHLDGAVNLPFDEIARHVDTVRGNSCLLYCATGMRSRRATKKLRSLGIEEAHNIGSFSEARTVLDLSCR